jgi:hypothetical protein
VNHAAIVRDRLGVGRTAHQRCQPRRERVAVGVEMHHVHLLVVRKVELRREGVEEGAQAEDRRQARGLDRLGRRRIAIDDEQVRRAVVVGPRAEPIGRRIRARVGEGLQAGRQRPAVLDHVDAEVTPRLPQGPDAGDAALAAERPHVDVPAFDAGVREFDGLEDLQRGVRNVRRIDCADGGIEHLLGRNSVPM